MAVTAKGRRQSSEVPQELGESLKVAEKRGLLSGGRTRMIAGRMPEPLVRLAKLQNGITSDSKLIEAALAKVAVRDDVVQTAVADTFMEWFTSQRGTVSKELDLDAYLL